METPINSCTNISSLTNTETDSILSKLTDIQNSDESDTIKFLSSCIILLYKNTDNIEKHVGLLDDVLKKNVIKIYR